MRNGTYKKLFGTRSSATKASLFMALVLIAAASLWLGSCATAPAPIPDDLSAAQLIQRAQEAGDISDWKSAERYYRTALERFGTDDQVRCACEYELAFIAYKQGKYAVAKTGLTALLERYAAPGGASLPTTWKILAEKVLARIPDTVK
jgi:outer membrane protein assembly factor BamD (BamD/ComL family)